MSTKLNMLREAMIGVQNRAPAQDPSPIAAHPAPRIDPALRRSVIAAARIGKRSIGGHFSVETLRQMRVLAAESDCTIQDLLAEALNDLFRKHNKSAIA